MSLLQKIQALKFQAAALEDDARKAEGGNKSAATRVRTGLMNVIKTCKELRTDVTVLKSVNSGD